MDTDTSSNKRQTRIRTVQVGHEIFGHGLKHGLRFRISEGSRISDLVIALVLRNDSRGMSQTIQLTIQSYLKFHGSFDESPGDDPGQ